jgi:hypothetical protein
MQHSQQVQFFPDPSLPPGQGDLEALERLKEIIKSNQHEIFRATPRPAALASLYKGSLLSAVPPHPEQIPNNPKEKPTTAPSSPTFEKPSSSTFIRDAHSAHVVAAVQGATRPSISNDTVRALLRIRRCHPLICDCCVASFQCGESAESEPSLD